MQINHEDVTEATRPQPASPSLRVAMWEAPDAPGPVMTLRGRMMGWEGFYAIREALMKAFVGAASTKPLAINLLELAEACPLTLSMLASTLQDALRQGHHFRLLLPPGVWCEYLIPRLVNPTDPACVKRIPKLQAIALDR